jgi:hypothetical protein
MTAFEATCKLLHMLLIAAASVSAETDLSAWTVSSVAHSRQISVYQSASAQGASMMVISDWPACKQCNGLSMASFVAAAAAAIADAAAFEWFS